MSSLALRRSSSPDAGVVLSHGNKLTCLYSSLSILPPRPTSSTISSVKIAKTSSHTCFSGEKTPLSDSWVERSSLLRRLMTDYSSEAIGATLYPINADMYQSLKDRKRVLGTSPFPSRTMENVIVDAPFSRVRTHSFFSTEAMSDGVRSATMPNVAVSLPPAPLTTARTPPVESFFSPLSLLPNTPAFVNVGPSDDECCSFCWKVISESGIFS
ncbi:hypothetical protein ZOSMA_30G00050 [Zostera marina]|uniref:Uncharacterized protein n=1 Tax=Zostera marina TaxID=29655 RepID=A0A0K9P9T3_ZOSMR|nr:hypothetical protein ZOSMA_30G00050 [Zostera marina]